MDWAMVRRRQARLTSRTARQNGQTGESETMTDPRPSGFERPRDAGDPLWPTARPDASSAPARRRLSPGQLLGILGLAVFLLPGLMGWAYAAFFGSMYLAGALLWHILRGRSWLNLFVPRMRRKGAAVVGLPSALALFVVGTLGAGATASRPVVAASTQPAVAVTASITPVTSDPTAAQPTGPAAELLATLVERTSTPEPTFNRAEFGQAWADVDRNGCDTRNDVLRRDLISVQVKPGTQGCAVSSGTLMDKYSAAAVAFESGTETAIQVDHVVALRNAWQSGAAAWSADERVAFANDPLNLLATTHEMNSLKGERDAGGWLPPNSAFVCEYVARQVAVKAKYRLTVATAEAETSANILRGCPGQALPVLVPIALMPDAVMPTATPAPSPAASPLPLSGVGGTTTTSRPAATSTWTKPTSTTTRPASTTTTTRPAATTTTTAPPAGGCPIKGNISDKGEKIYHVPGQQFYAVTKIDVSKGERWFCTEAQAVSAGWRKSLR